MRQAGRTYFIFFKIYKSIMKPTVIKQNIGIDIALKNFKCCFQQQLSTAKRRVKATRTFSNNSTGFKAFLVWMNQKKDASVALSVTMEATGVYYEQLACFLHEQPDVAIYVLLPNMVKAYIKSHNVKTKTDHTDAKMLGLLGLERPLSKWIPASPQMRLLKQQTRERDQLLKRRTAIANQLHACRHMHQPNRLQISRLEALLVFLRQQLQSIEKELLGTVEADPQLAERVANICTTKGLSWKSVLPIIAETGGFVLFHSVKQVVSYAGYDVVQNESGSSIKGKTKISKKGNKWIRKALHFPALSAVQHEPVLKALWERVFARTQIKMKAYVAVQRKLLVLIYTLFKKNEPYQREPMATASLLSKSVCLSE